MSSPTTIRKPNNSEKKGEGEKKIPRSFKQLSRLISMFFNGDDDSKKAQMRIRVPPPSD